MQPNFPIIILILSNGFHKFPRSKGLNSSESFRFTLPLQCSAEQIKKKPHVLVSNVESLTSPDVQQRISQLNIGYISVDEAQV